MEYQKSKGFENFIRSRLKVRIEFLERYSTLFPELVDQEELSELLKKVGHLKNLDFASLYLLEIDITETETEIQNMLKKM